MKVIANTLYTVLIATLLVVAGFFLATLLPLPGKIEVKIVQSGSMEPAIPTGSVVVIAPSSAYAVGDVITFGKDSARDVPTTHRIAEVTDTGFITKGDANEERDVNPVPAGDVIGKVYLHVPYAGFVLDFARKPLGFALLIGLPALLIIFDELFTIIGEVGKLRRRKEKKQQPTEIRQSTTMHDIRVVRTERPVQHYPARKLVMGLVGAVGLIGGVGFGHIGSTVSYLGDIERSLGNMLGAAASFDEPLVEPTFAPFMIVEEAQTDTPIVDEPVPPTEEPTVPPQEEEVSPQEPPAPEVLGVEITPPEPEEKPVDDPVPPEVPKEEEEEIPPADEPPAEVPQE